MDTRMSAYMGVWEEKLIERYTSLKRAKVTAEEATEINADGERIIKRGYYTKTKDSGETSYYTDVEAVDYDKARFDIAIRDSRNISIVCRCIIFFTFLVGVALFFFLLALYFRWYNYNLV